MSEAVALVVLDCLDDGRRAVVRDGDGNLTLADLDDGGRAMPLFKPTSIERLLVFADHAASGAPGALTHPKAILFLATAALALAVAFDHAREETTYVPDEASRN